MNAYFMPKLNGNKLVLRLVITQRGVIQKDMKQVRVTQVGVSLRRINQASILQRAIRQRGIIKQVGRTQIGIKRKQA